MVVGDLRWTLAISASVLNVPLVNLCNAFWSPYVRKFSAPLPDHPINKILGHWVAALFFPIALPFAMGWMLRPFNALRRHYGLHKIPSLRGLVTWGDAVVYADPPGLVDLRPLPRDHNLLGHVPLGPQVESNERPAAAAPFRPQTPPQAHLKDKVSDERGSI